MISVRQHVNEILPLYQYTWQVNISNFFFKDRNIRSDFWRFVNFCDHQWRARILAIQKVFGIIVSLTHTSTIVIVLQKADQASLLLFVYFCQADSDFFILLKTFYFPVKSYVSRFRTHFSTCRSICYLPYTDSSKG